MKEVGTGEAEMPTPCLFWTTPRSGIFIQLESTLLVRDVLCASFEIIGSEGFCSFVSSLGEPICNHI